MNTMPIGVEGKGMWHSRPQTVNIDGWQATRNAFVYLFSSITPILCLLHGFISIRDRSRKEHPLHQALWEVYRCEDAQQFQALTRQNELHLENGSVRKTFIKSDRPPSLP